MRKRKPSAACWFVIIIVFFTLHTSCTGDKSPINCTITEFEEFPGNRDLIFSDLAEYQYGNVSNILVCDSLLVVGNRDRNSKYFFYNYSLTQNKFSKGYLKRGKGPGEALGVFTSGISQDLLWAHDVSKGSIYQMKLDDILQAGFVHPYSVSELNDSYFHLSMVDSSNYWAVGNLISESKITFGKLNNPDGSAEFGNFCLIDEDVPIQVFKDAHSSIILSKPDGEKILVAYRYTDVIEIIDVNDQSIKTIQGPESFNVEYTVGESESHRFMQKTKKTKKAFVNGAVTDEYIYLLFSGFKSGHENWSYAKELFVYTWEGLPVMSYNLDRSIYTIGIDQKGSTIYSLDETTAYLISAQLTEESLMKSLLLVNPLFFKLLPILCTSQK